LQDDENDHDDEQDVDNIPSAREAGKKVWTKISEQPQNEQDYDNPGKHEISPFELLNEPNFIL
jgi:hypothetical protein